MDLAIRQQLQQALAQAIARHAPIAITAGGRQLLLACDLTCFENHIEGTDQDGRPVTLRYAEIEAVAPHEARAPATP